MSMLAFFKQNRFILSLTALALAAAAITVFFPPAILVAATLALASAPAFAFLGTFAVAAAITTSAVVAAASVYAVGAIGYGLFKAFESVRDHIISKSANESASTVESVTMDTLADDHNGSAKTLAALGKNETQALADNQEEKSQRVDLCSSQLYTVDVSPQLYTDDEDEDEDARARATAQ